MSLYEIYYVVFNALEKYLSKVSFCRIEET